jgi:hypothetical protein
MTGEPRLVTYGELIRTLGRLGYTLDRSRSIPTYSVYHHPDASVGIYLPVLPDDQVMKRIYLVGIHHILQESNPAAAPEFERWASTGKLHTAGAK